MLPAGNSKGVTSMKKRNERRPKVGTIGYYIEEVVNYRAECESKYVPKYGDAPVVAELLLSILISLRATQRGVYLVAGVLMGLIFKKIL